MAKAKVCSKTTDEKGVITFTFADEAKTTRAVDPSKFPESVQDHFKSHGASQKFGDTYAGAGSESDPAAYAIGQFDAMHEGLMKGDWSTRTPGGEPRTTLLIEACAEIRKVEVDDMREFVDGLSDDDKKALRSDPRVKATIDAIKARKSAEAAKGKDSILDAL